jgi:hypothetical protein
MLELISSGTVFGLVIGLMLLEGLVLTLHGRRSRRGMAVRDLWPNLLAGVGLLAAALTVVRGGDPRLAGSLMFVALLAHLLDLRLRWRH